MTSIQDHLLLLDIYTDTDYMKCDVLSDVIVSCYQ